MSDFAALAMIGIGLPSNKVEQMAAFAMDDQQGGITVGSISTPIQFLQTWLRASSAPSRPPRRSTR